ncbi:MAG: poly-beta-1,6-N-acetyl-D-glucosamine biosynthesis protein PgaD, partial [Gammaproteobacteria bacterium]|nr:poly-beta-1,6-N-acetyl-D-glucosamine biosynthesis protein PgaD [Gammaproteobacteria bacterium]
AIFYDVAMDAEEDVFSLSFFTGYGVALGGLGVSLAAWTSYNRLRFRRRCRRSNRCRPVGVRELAAFFSVASEDVLVWRRTRRLSIRTDAEGGIERVESIGKL